MPFSVGTSPHERILSSLAEARLGDHLVHLFDTGEERDAAAAELLASGLAHGARALGLGGEASLAALAGALGALGVDVATARSRGALQLEPAQHHYLAGGAFDGSQVLAAWRARADAARTDGFGGLVVVADMAWALPGGPGAARLVEYEASLGLVLRQDLIILCQYDARAFDAEVQRGLLRSHALVLHGGTILRNPAALPPEAALAKEPAGEEVARLLAALHAQARAEEALRQSEARFRLLAENARDLVYRYRLAPEPGFEYVSPSATAMTGYTPEDHYADPELGAKIVHPEDRERLRAYALEPSPGPLLLRWIRRDGVVVWAEQQNTVVLDEAGAPVAIEGIARDVTERRSAEEALRTAERLAGLGRLAAGVAHEINNPLAWMGSNVRFVLEALAALDAKGATGGLGELRQALSEVVDGVARVRAIVGGLEQLAGPARGAERNPQEVLASLRAELEASPRPAGRAGPAPAATPAVTPAPRGARRGRVLVIDDEPLVARSVTRILAAEHDVTTLTSSREALRRATAGERWDLVLCDLMMPELSGMELVRRLAEAAPGLADRFVFLTGGAYTPEAQAFLDAGWPYLEKPPSPADLRARAAEVVRQAWAAHLEPA